MPFPRRVVLRLLGALAILVALPASRARARVTGPSRAETLLALLPHPESAAVIGREYLRVTPDEADRDRLCAMLWPADALPGSLGEALARRQRADFAEGRTVRLRGWILARTEARLCALAALCPNGAMDRIA